MNIDDKNIDERIFQLEEDMREVKANQRFYYMEKDVIVSHIRRFNKRFRRLSKIRKWIIICALLILLLDYFVTPNSWFWWAFLPLVAYFIVLFYTMMLNEVSDIYVILGTEQDEWTDEQTKTKSDPKKKYGSKAIDIDKLFSD